MFRADKTARIFGRTSVLTAAVAAGGLGVAASSTQADTIGPIDFDQASDFSDNFNVVNDGGEISVNTANSALELPDSGSHDSPYAVVKQSNGDTTFNVTSITTRIDGGWDNAANSSRYYGPTVLGTPDSGSGSATYQATLRSDGSAFDLFQRTYGTTDSGSTGPSLASDSNLGNFNPDSSSLERIEITADDFDSANGTADITAKLYVDGDFSSPISTLTLDDRDLSSDGTSANGQAGVGRFGQTNGQATIDRFEVEFTPIPEPGSLALLGLGGLVLGLPRRRRRA